MKMTSKPTHTFGHFGFLPAFLFILLILVYPIATMAQRGSPDVTLQVTKTAFRKIDLLIDDLDVLSGGVRAAEAAETAKGILSQDLEFSGLFRVGDEVVQVDAGGDTLRYEFTIEGVYEGPLHDAGTTGEESAATLTLKLLTWPGGQSLLVKRYTPLPRQLRSCAHHFAGQVVELLTGAKGITLSRIVFSRGSGDRRDLHCLDYDGENLLRLTANRTLNLCPAWSPDSKHIAFTSYTRGQQGVFLIETATGHVRNVIATEGLNLGADWHPDGTELVLSLSKSGNPEIYRIDLQGKEIRRLTVSSAIEISPSWSPGGRDLVFTSDRTGTPQLYMVDGDGANRRRLSFEGQYNDSAAWSPSGEEVVYACREGNYTRLVLISSTGENRRYLTGTGWRSCEDPSWARDGRHIVFASDRTGVFKLYVMDVTDGTSRQLTFGEQPDITPSWSR